MRTPRGWVLPGPHIVYTHTPDNAAPARCYGPFPTHGDASAWASRNLPNHGYYEWSTLPLDEPFTHVPQEAAA